MVTIPPDLPIEGTNTKESKFLGQKFLKNCKSIFSLFVSWKERHNKNQASAFWQVRNIQPGSKLRKGGWISCIYVRVFPSSYLVYGKEKMG
jgi:hypothetical protein